MANTLIQFRDDEQTKIQATIVCERVGIDLQTYLKMSLRRLIAQNDLPFVPLPKQTDSPLMRIVKSCQETAKINGNENITLEEINAEIDAVRRGK